MPGRFDVPGFGIAAKLVKPPTTGFVGVGGSGVPGVPPPPLEQAPTDSAGAKQTTSAVPRRDFISDPFINRQKTIGTVVGSARYWTNV